MRTTYRVLAGLIALGVVVQAAAVALGWFITLADIDDGQVVDKAYLEDDGWNVGLLTHSIVGLNLMPLLGLVLFVISFFAKFPGAVKWAGFTFLAIIVQVLLAFLSFGVGELGFLHGINAFVVLGLAANAARRATTAGTEPITRAETATV